jgi:MFS family permease
MTQYTNYNAGKLGSLTKELKKAVGLLSIGTFLEYFDLMLYVHMAVLLNELFFPKADPYTTAIYSAAAFCSTYVLRPFGAIIFGWVGDNIGRKPTLVVTTLMTAFSCFVMTITPTYAEVGLISAILVTMCRIIQGLSSLGEGLAAELYLTESVGLPLRYPVVASITIFSMLGGTAALAVASLVVTYECNWRYAFLFGASIAIIGAIARTALRETPEFVDAKRRVSRVIIECNRNTNILQDNLIWEQRVSTKTSISYFLIFCSSTISFFIAFIYCPQILKNNYSYTIGQVIHQNLLIAIIGTLSCILLALISYKIHPLRILKLKLYFSITLTLILPYILHYFNSGGVLIVQLAFASFWIFESPATPVLYKHFPVLKRFTYSNLLFALSRIIMYVVTAFGVVYLVEHLNYWGLWIIIIPIIIGYSFALNYLITLEKEVGNYL